MSMNEVVNIARCPEHGLHGERTECFVCGGDVEQVPMVPFEAESVERAAIELHRQAEWRFPWASTDEDEREMFRQRARMVLGAAGRILAPPPARSTHRVETYKPRPRPKGETRAKIAALVSSKGIAGRWER
jgi:hypothetical protein